MRLKLKELQEVANKALFDEKIIDTLREELSRVLGSSILVDVSLQQLAEGANDCIDVFERTGRTGRFDFKPSVLLRFVDNKSAEVRRLVARLLPEQYVIKMRHDKDAAVRHAVARRLPLRVIKEMRSRWPNDDELYEIESQKTLDEAGLPTPKNLKNEPFDMNGEKEFSKATQNGNAQDDDLSNQWYETKAYKLIQDYGNNMEGQWEELAVRRFCASTQATSGVEIDQQKLYKEVVKQLKEKEDRGLERSALKEIAQFLRESSEPELPRIVSEDIDPVQSLLENKTSSSEYVKNAFKVFNVRGKMIYRLSEGAKLRSVKIPKIGQLPVKREVTRIDEQALDLFVRNWNSIRSMKGDPVRIEWSPNPSKTGLISFSIKTK